MIKKTGLILIICLVVTVAGASCFKLPVGIVDKSSPTPTNTSPAWFIDPYLANIAYLVLDYQTLKLKSVYFSREETCSSAHPPVSEEELKTLAGGIFTANGKDYSKLIVTDENGNEREEIHFETKYMGNFVILEIPPIDIGGVAISDRCSGLVLFAGSIIWAGKGEQLYPANPIDPQSLIHKKATIPAPQKVDVVIGTEVTNVNQAKGLDAWNSIQDLNLVQSLASQPYEVLVYLYPRTVGMYNPEAAEWVVFVYRYPTSQ